MPRLARQKTPESIFHIFCRSIPEVMLYKDDDDKRVYLGVVKKYQKIYQFKVYGYCLMDNHNHLIIDANGADISKVMHSINLSYARYYNRVHKRYGHLFQDRFRSKMVESEGYLYKLSAYVHNNALDIPGYAEHPENYVFSSLGIYLGMRQDPFELVSTGFVLRMFSGNVRRARERYIDYVYRCDDSELKKEIEFEDEGTEYRSGRTILVRKMEPERVVAFVAEKFDVSEIEIRMKHSRGIMEAKAILVVLLRSLCSFNCVDICSLLGNITESRVSKLSSRGIGLIGEDERYGDIIREFVDSYAA